MQTATGLRLHPAVRWLYEALLIRELVRDSESLNEEAKLVSIVKHANSAGKHFGDLKYWAIDSAVTQLAAFQQKADLAASQLDSDLKAISEVDPTVVAAIEGEVTTMTDLGRQAGVAYSSDDSAAGNTVDQYVGDGMIAVFGATTASPDDAANALSCAERMLGALERWNQEREKKREDPIDIGIGVNHGPVVLGDVGSEHGMSFTAIGDMVNTAARLQALTRSLDTPLVVGDAVVQAIQASSPELATERIGLLEDRGEHNLRGREHPVRIWTRKVPRRGEPTRAEAAS